jgi:hypothetical protein
VPARDVTIQKDIKNGMIGIYNNHSLQPKDYLLLLNGRSK